MNHRYSLGVRPLEVTITCNIPNLQCDIPFSHCRPPLLDNCDGDRECYEPLRRLNATVGTTSSLHCPEPRTLTKDVLPDAYLLDYSQSGSARIMTLLTCSPTMLISASFEKKILWNQLNIEENIHDINTSTGTQWG